jgi:hypothetical protein
VRLDKVTQSSRRRHISGSRQAHIGETETSRQVAKLLPSARACSAWMRGALPPVGARKEKCRVKNLVRGVRMYRGTPARSCAGTLVQWSNLPRLSGADATPELRVLNPARGLRMASTHLETAYQQLAKKCTNSQQEQVIEGISRSDALQTAFEQLSNAGQPPRCLAEAITLLEESMETQLSTAGRRHRRRGNTLTEHGRELQPDCLAVDACDLVLNRQLLVAIFSALEGNDLGRKFLLAVLKFEIDYKDNRRLAQILNCKVAQISTIKKQLAAAARSILQANRGDAK